MSGALALWAAIPVAAAALIGQAFTTPNLAPWYETLAKPAFTPPNWIFGPVWTCLYVMMAVAFWRILRAPDGDPGRGEAIGLFLLQLVVNAVWSIAFFGLRSPGVGFGVILVLLALIVATMRSFLAVDRAAGWLLAPYLAWVAFAAALNAAIWSLN